MTALLAMLACLPASLLAQTTNATTPKRVLALHVVRRDSPGFDATFRSVLAEDLSDTLDYYSEYIDLNRLGDQKYQSALRGYLRTRYAEDGVDLVIASGPSVVEFLNSDLSLFEGVPLVFTTRPGLLGGPHSTGIVSAVDFTSTITAALDAQPDSKQIYVVSGVAPFDRLYADIFRSQRERFATRVIFQDLAGLPLRSRRLSDSPILAKVERLLSPFATARLGFRADLDARRLLTKAGLTPVSIRKVNTPQLWTLLRCRRENEA